VKQSYPGESLPLSLITSEQLFSSPGSSFLLNLRTALEDSTRAPLQTPGMQPFDDDVYSLAGADCHYFDIFLSKTWIARTLSGNLGKG
jgi:hypothetical protein